MGIVYKAATRGARTGTPASTFRLRERVALNSSGVKYPSMRAPRYVGGGPLSS